MNKAELLSDPSLIVNEDGNILCVKTQNGREHHLKPEVVLNTARMSNEGWMVKRKAVANGNGHSAFNPELKKELVEYFDKTPEPIKTVDPQAEYKVSEPLPKEPHEQAPELLKDIKLINPQSLSEIKPKRKGGRPVGSRNKKTKKEVINTHDPVTGFPATVILEMDIPKKKGGRPKGSKNRNNKKKK